jgi:bifunctional DNA-binding transcriptional regulator/antitoxin component of YhaV-PrlF toxin-antitoxin module
MTSKGQVTIPLAVRQALSLEPGVRVQFDANGDGSFTLRAATRPVSELFGLCGTYDGPRVTVEDMNDTIMDAVAEAYS